jgi:hypothetical protein
MSYDISHREGRLNADLHPSEELPGLRYPEFRKGISNSREDPGTIPDCTWYIMVARNPERCGGHT